MNKQKEKLIYPDINIQFLPLEEQWELIKNAFKSENKQPPERELKEIRLTLIVNYGKDGRTIKGVVLENDSTYQMVLKVLMHYHKLSQPQQVSVDNKLVEALKKIKELAYQETHCQRTIIGIRNLTEQALSTEAKEGGGDE